MPSNTKGKIVHKVQNNNKYGVTNVIMMELVGICFDIVVYFRFQHIRTVNNVNLWQANRHRVEYFVDITGTVHKARYSETTYFKWHVVFIFQRCEA